MKDHKAVIKKVLNVAYILVLFACVITIVYLCNQITILGSVILDKGQSRGEIANILDIMEEIDYLYKTKYIGDDYSIEDLEDYALAGFSAGYGDRYGYYMSPQDSTEQEYERLEQLAGIGVEVVYEAGKGYYVIGTYSNSPAQNSGIEAGDYIIEANGENIEEVGKDRILELIKGEVGTTVDITLDKSTGEQTNVQVERANVRTESVTSELVTDEIAYIKIDKFTEYTASEFIRELKKYQSQDITKYVLDLRNNTGGVADSAITALDYMLPSGLIVEFVEKEEVNNKQYYSNSQQIDAEIVILTNGGTASASELVCQALRDYGMATIVGEKTFGKGTVLSTYALANGGTITLSTAKYYTKSGYEIEENGILPDIEIEMPIEQKLILYKLDKSEDIQFQKALEILER